MSEPSHQLENVVRWVLPRAMAVIAAFALPVLAYKAVGGFTESRAFVVEHVTVEGNARLSDAEVLAAAGFAAARNVLTVDETDVRRATESHPWVRTASARVNFRARTVDIVVEERELAGIALAAATTLIDTTGEPIAPWTPADGYSVPVVTGIPLADAAAFRDAFAVAEQVRATDVGAEHPVVEIAAVGVNGFRVTLANGFEVRIAGDRVEERLARLDEAIAAAERRGIRPIYAHLDTSNTDRVVVGQADPISPSPAAGDHP